MNVLRRPFTLNEPSRGVCPPVFRAERRTPVVSSASEEYSRPFNGSARVWSPVITCPRWLVSVSSRVAAAETSTRSVICPTCMARSTRCRAPTVT